MRNKLLIVVALAVLGASVTAGTAGAGAGSLIGVGEGGVQINLPSGQNLEDLQLLPQCSNTADDDGDGLTDLGDPDCTGPLDATESGSGAPATTTPVEPTDPAPAQGGGGQGGGGGGGAQSGGNGVGGGSVGSGGGSGGRGESDGTALEADEEATEVPESERQPMEPTSDRNADGSPADTNPGLTVADFGPAPVGVPNFVIDQFSIPPFLLPIYQACGTEYGIPWQVLASINRIETAFGTNLNVSSAGALGWMQFIPSSWQMYGVDANDDGRKDPYNPVDAICAAARYLRAAGGQEDLRTAIFAYNHADWYVDEVLLYANQYGKLPADLVSSLTGLTEGARFPVAANARYADDISERQALRRSTPSKRASGNAADVISRLTHSSRDRHLRPRGRPGGRRQRRRHHRDRQLEAPRALRHPARRLRQPLHLRQPRRGLRGLPGAEGVGADGEGLRARDAGRSREAEPAGDGRRQPLGRPRRRARPRRARARREGR